MLSSLRRRGARTPPIGSRACTRREQHVGMARPRCITYSIASVDGRLTVAPEVNLMAGDPRWEAATAGLGDPYPWIRREHDPQVLLEGSGSFMSPAYLDELPDPDPPTDSEDPPPKADHFLPDDVVTATVGAGSPWWTAGAAPRPPVHRMARPCLGWVARRVRRPV